MGNQFKSCAVKITVVLQWVDIILRGSKECLQWGQCIPGVGPQTVRKREPESVMGGTRATTDHTGMMLHTTPKGQIAVLEPDSRGTQLLLGANTSQLIPRVPSWVVVPNPRLVGQRSQRMSTVSLNGGTRLYQPFLERSFLTRGN